MKSSQKNTTPENSLPDYYLEIESENGIKKQTNIFTREEILISESEKIKGKLEQLGIERITKIREIKPINLDEFGVSLSQSITLLKTLDNYLSKVDEENENDLNDVLLQLETIKQILDSAYKELSDHAYLIELSKRK